MRYDLPMPCDSDVFWPWWLGALALAGIALGFRRLMGRDLGVSGMWARAVEFRAAGGSAPLQGRDSPGVHLTFLVMLAVGGWLASLGHGDLTLKWDLGPDFTRLFGGGMGGVAVLLVGGMLTGFGTRMSGGCTSGHGLVGCGSLSVPSFLATAAFFGAGVALSLLLEGLLG